jgi:hypothetical protein
MPFTFTFARNIADNIAIPITVNFGVGGSAIFGTDYTVTGAATFTATNGSIVIPSGQISANLVATVIPDAITEADETIVLTPVATSGVFVIGGSPTTTATIFDDDGTGGSVLLLVNFVGANNSTAIVDISPSPKTISVFGNTNIFNNKGVFDGNGDYLEIANSALNISNYPNSTIEIIYEGNTTANQILLATYNQATGQSGHLILANTLLSNGNATLTNLTPTTGTNTHVALVHDNASGNYLTYQGGVLVNTTASGVLLQTGSLYIGGSPGDNNIGTWWLDAKLIGVRISDYVRYNAAFVPPTSF